MAIEDVQMFLQALEQDESLAVRADDAFVNALHGLAIEEGYDISADVLRAALDDAAASLGDAELDRVVAGSGQFGASMANTAGITGATEFYSATPAPTQIPHFNSFSKTGFSR